MESGNSRSDNQQGGANAGNHPSWVRRHLDGSIYLWACGEKADGDGDDPKASDRLIGWLILFVQGFAYLMLLVLSGIALESDTDSSANGIDSWPSCDYARYTEDDGGLSSSSGGTVYSASFDDDSSGATDDDCYYFGSGYTDDGGYFGSGYNDDSGSISGSGATYDSELYSDSDNYDDSKPTYYEDTGYYFGSSSITDDNYYGDGRFNDDGVSTLYNSGDTYYDKDYSFGTGSNDESGQQTESPFLLPAVAGAMYLLIASTSHDFRAGFSLLVGGECAGHRAFGIGLLVVYGVMLSAALSVLVSTSHDNASVVLNAVTVIFIADLDEKALKFLSTVPRKWRLFWAIYSIGISFVLAMFAVVHIGEDANGEFTLPKERTRSSLEELPGWIFWVLNPLAVTILSYYSSACVIRVFEPSNAAFETADQQTRSCVAATVFVRAIASIKRAIECVRKDPCFFVAITVWVAQAAVCWAFFEFWGHPVGVTMVLGYSKTSGEYCSFVPGNKSLLVLVNACLAAGLALKGLGILLRRYSTVIASGEPRRTSVISRAPPERCVGFTDHMLSSLLVGWGIGYWVTTLLLVLGTSWEISGCYDEPTSLSVVTFVVVACFMITSILMVADKTFLGAKAEAFIKPAIERIQNTRGVVYWIMATVFRDILTIWACVGMSVVYVLDVIY